MKKLLLGFLLLVVAHPSQAQNIPNAGFENWTPYGNGEYPDFWTTSDSVTFAYQGGNSAYSGTDSYEGSKCLHLKSTQITFLGFPIKGPGFATNGTMSLVGTSFEFKGGSPDTARSRYFNGYFKYLPSAAGDEGLVKVFLLRDNAGTKDTIAAGTTSFTGTVSTYTQFVTEMIYRDFVNRPDTCLIILQSSKGVNDPTVAVGTELIIDSIGFSGFVGINELSNSITNVKVFPSPADQELVVEVSLKKATELNYEIIDLTGKLILSSAMKSTKDIVDVSQLSNGKYIIKITDKNGGSVFSSDFMIHR